MKELPVYCRGEILLRAALVDDNTAHELADKRLTIHAGYIFAGQTALHRLVMGCTKNDGKVVHHINEDAFDNRRENLVVCNSLKEHAMLPHPRMMSIVRGEFSGSHEPPTRDHVLAVLEWIRTGQDCPDLVVAR